MRNEYSDKDRIYEDSNGIARHATGYTYDWIDGGEDDLDAMRQSWRELLALSDDSDYNAVRVNVTNYVSGIALAERFINAAIDALDMVPDFTMPENIAADMGSEASDTAIAHLNNLHDRYGRDLNNARTAVFVMRENLHNLRARIVTNATNKDGDLRH